MEVKQKQTFDKNKKLREFKSGQKIFVKNEINQGNRPAIIVDGRRVMRKHSDQIKERIEREPEEIHDLECENYDRKIVQQFLQPLDYRLPYALKQDILISNMYQDPAQQKNKGGRCYDLRCTSNRLLLLLTYSVQTVELTVFVTPGNDIPLLGRYWMEDLGMESQSSQINALDTTYNDSMIKIISKYMSRRYNSLKMQCHMFTNLGFPVFYQKKSGIRTKGLVKESVLEYVDPSTICLNWASPAVNVLKPDGQYAFVVILDNAPVIFQRFMESAIQDIPGVSDFLDDNIISGKDVDQNLERVEKVLQRLIHRNIQNKTKKGKFLTDIVKNWQYLIDKEGIHPYQENLKPFKILAKPDKLQEA
ncbi:hypothetical protein RF11_07351 [Thelohanellus kitauei]|uniref:Uncharacterized protein n=1 Tax=Thelohanellus kitauei TaxID=669202 RepID=A0A0C2MFW7_THEKT|nr:hypothetical protein RF11_07351 [Thelohanellus kitauei]